MKQVYKAGCNSQETHEAGRKRNLTKKWLKTATEWLLVLCRFVFFPFKVKMIVGTQILFLENISSENNLRFRVKWLMCIQICFS